MFGYDNLQNASKAELVATVSILRLYSQVLLTAYEARVMYGVDYRKLPEYGQLAAVTAKANTMKPVVRTNYVSEYMSKLDKAILAAVRRTRDVHLVHTSPNPHNIDGY